MNHVIPRRRAKDECKYPRTINGRHRPEYQSWHAMVSRCYNPNFNKWRYYGGRGITVCDKWLHSFDAFFEDMGIRPSKTTLDRIDSNKRYEPDNCRWADGVTQARHLRHSVECCIHCGGSFDCKLNGIITRRVWKGLCAKCNTYLRTYGKLKNTK